MQAISGYADARSHSHDNGHSISIATHSVASRQLDVLFGDISLTLLEQGLDAWYFFVEDVVFSLVSY